MVSSPAALPSLDLDALEGTTYMPQTHSEWQHAGASAAAPLLPGRDPAGSGPREHAAAPPPPPAGAGPVVRAAAASTAVPTENLVPAFVRWGKLLARRF
jgi:hypothetical protein